MKEKNNKKEPDQYKDILFSLRKLINDDIIVSFIVTEKDIHIGVVQTKTGLKFDSDADDEEEETNQQIPNVDPITKRMNYFG